MELESVVLDWFTVRQRRVLQPVLPDLREVV